MGPASDLPFALLLSGVGVVFESVWPGAAFAVLVRVWSANLTVTVVVAAWFWLSSSIGEIRDELCVGLVGSGSLACVGRLAVATVAGVSAVFVGGLLAWCAAVGSGLGDLFVADVSRATATS